MQPPLKQKILFLHGFFASGQCTLAETLREVLSPEIEVISPDLPLRPDEAISLIRNIIDREKPSLLVGNSCGAFYAQMLAPIVGLPALLGNPHFRMTEFLRMRLGDHEYKSSRRDGNQRLSINEESISLFATLENEQFNYYDPFYKDRVWGLFGDQDPLAHFEPIFREHYLQSYHFPGGHTPTADEVKEYYVPLIRQMLQKFPRRAEGTRYFRHFKGRYYRLLQTALDSETTERMVVYQALYGDHLCWVRPEKMFFEATERQGQWVKRFSEIDQMPTEE